MSALTQMQRAQNESRVIRAQILDDRKYGLTDNPLLVNRLDLIVRDMHKLRASLLRLQADLIEDQLESVEPIIPDYLPEDL